MVLSGIQLGIFVDSPYSCFVSEDNEFFSGYFFDTVCVKVLHLFQRHASVKLTSFFFEYLLRWNLVFISSVFFFSATLIKNEKWQ